MVFMVAKSRPALHRKGMQTRGRLVGNACATGEDVLVLLRKCSVLQPEAAVGSAIYNTVQQCVAST